MTTTKTCWMVDVLGEPVGVDVGVFTGVLVGIDIGVTAGILVGVGVAVTAGILVGVGEIVELATGVGVLVSTGKSVDVAVAAREDDPVILTINLGEFAPDSRDARLIAVEPGVVTPKLNVPSPVTYDVTSNVTQVPPTTAGEDTRVLPIAGALV